MTDWLLIYLEDQLSAHRAPEESKGALDDCGALLRLFGNEIHGCFLHGRHCGCCKTGRESTQGSATPQLAQGRVYRAALPGCSGAGFEVDKIGEVQLHRGFAPIGKFYGPIEKARPYVTGASLQTALVWEAGVYPVVNLNLEIKIELVEEFFLGRKIGEERARGYACALRDLGCRRAEPGRGDLMHRRLENCAAFLGTSDSCHATDESTAV
jgi:hypothetical protein